MSPGSMSVSFDARDLRISGGLMLGAAAVLPLLPIEPGFACPLRTWTGIPCPLCGMTTSVVAVRTPGTVTFMNERNRFAPSTAAASYSSFETPCNAAR